MDQKVLIMLAAYNGEKYIGKQIESIIAQDYTNRHLVIQDDGSKDNTANIVKEYCKKDSRISYIVNETDKHGPFYNFHVMIGKFKEKQGYEYYMFSDQDDIWLSNKLSTMISVLSNSKKPKLCYGDMQIIDGNDKITDQSVDKIMSIHHTNKYRFFFVHKVYGCNLMMNKALFEKVPAADINNPNVAKLSHDNYYTKFAEIYGDVIYIDKPLMQYRRHSENVTAGQQYNVDTKKIVKRIFSFGDLAKQHANTYNQTLYTLSILKRMGCKNKAIDEIEKTIRTGGIKGYRFIKKHHISWGTKASNISRAATMITGAYKKYLI